MDELGRLQWQCRRGSRELDLILKQYLEFRYPNADEQERARFKVLLQLDDAALWEAWQQYNYPTDLKS